MARRRRGRAAIPGRDHRPVRGPRGGRLALQRPGADPASAPDRPAGPGPARPPQAPVLSGGRRDRRAADYSIQMTWEELLAYCLAKPGAWQDEPWDGDVVVKVEIGRASCRERV